MNRRTLLNLVGRAGGVAAVLTTMKAMGLMATGATASTQPKLAQGSGTGTHVVILGAGIAGMTAAYELTKAGYRCTVLEAQNRAGGRCWTVRSGDVVTELDSQQTCPFETADSLYMNPGPARIPHHHTNVLGYCKELGVPLEVIVNENRAAYFQDDKAFGGQPMQSRRVVTDSRGYVAELLAKAISKNALDQEISATDKEKILEFVRSFGNLDENLLYKGSSRGGYTTPPGAGTTVGQRYDPIDLSELLKSSFWNYKMHFAEGYNQSATMLQPIGGMDQIAKAFEQKVGNLIQYNAVVKQIRKTSAGVRVVYTDQTGAEQAVEANYAICTFPLSMLSKIDTDFSPEYKAAIDVGAKEYINAIKVGFQSRRFWEEDSQIYGGISWTERDITQIWYPAAGFHADQGVIVSAYIWSNDICNRWQAMTPTQRMTQAIADSSTIHPTFAQEVSPSKGVTTAWGKIPYAEGGWIEWEDESRETAYPILNQPDGTIYLAGEHLSYITGWQEGAVLSAHQAVQAIAAKKQALAV